MAIDRDAFVGTLLPEGTVPAVAMVPPTTLGWNPDVKEYPFDPEKAKELLAAAKADGVPVDTTLHLIGRSNLFPGVTEVVEAMQQMLQDVGFNVDVQMVEVAQQEELYSKPFKEGRPPQMLVSSATTTARATRCSRCSSSTPATAGSRASADPKVDEMIAKAIGGDRRRARQGLVGALRLPARRGGAGRAALPHGELRAGRRQDRLHADDRHQLAARAGGHRASSERGRRGAHACALRQPH